MLGDSTRLRSQQTAQVVTERLVAVFSQPGTFVEIEIDTHYQGTDNCETLYPPLWLAPTHEDVVTLADNSEIIQCVTNEGVRASVIVGKPHTRTDHPAEIILGMKEE